MEAGEEAAEAEGEEVVVAAVCSDERPTLKLKEDMLRLQERERRRLSGWR